MNPVYRGLVSEAQSLCDDILQHSSDTIEMTKIAEERQYARIATPVVGLLTYTFIYPFMSDSTIAPSALSLPFVFMFSSEIYANEKKSNEIQAKLCQLKKITWYDQKNLQEAKFARDFQISAYENILRHVQTIKKIETVLPFFSLVIALDFIGPAAPVQKTIVTIALGSIAAYALLYKYYKGPKQLDIENKKLAQNYIEKVKVQQSAIAEELTTDSNVLELSMQLLQATASSQ